MAKTPSRFASARPKNRFTNPAKKSSSAQKKRRRGIAGALGQRRGAQWEACLKGYLDANDDNLTYHHHWHHPERGHHEGQYKAQGPPDLELNTPFGDAMIDAKASAQSTFRFLLLKGHQADTMERWYQMSPLVSPGAVPRFSGLLVCQQHVEQGQPFLGHLLPWSALRKNYYQWREARKHKRSAPASWSWERVAEESLYSAPATPYHRYNWIPPLCAHLRAMRAGGEE